jgi:hypothetical protein
VVCVLLLARGLKPLLSQLLLFVQVLPTGVLGQRPLAFFVAPLLQDITQAHITNRYTNYMQGV